MRTEACNEKIEQTRRACRRPMILIRPDMQTSYNMPKRFLTVKEVARLMGVTPLTVRNWDQRGKLAAYRHPVNNYRLYKVEDIEGLLKEVELSKNIVRPPSGPKLRKLKIEVS